MTASVTGLLYFSRAGRAGFGASQERTPELRPLTDKAVALFGLGAIGAPSAMELARAGLGELRMMDHDYIDPATTGHWPFGLSVSGCYKAEVIPAMIRRDYPLTRVRGIVHRLGGIREPEVDMPSCQSVLRDMTEGVSLIYDSTAELGVHYLLSDYAMELGVPYVGVVATQGGWGGKVFRVWPGETEGCWLCYRFACDDGVIPEPPFDPGGEVQPLGCADPTFTGSGFDLVQVALVGVRMAVATLCAKAPGGYPEAPWDVLHVSFRGDGGELIPPQFLAYTIKEHPKCPRCGSSLLGGG